MIIVNNLALGMSNTAALTRGRHVLRSDIGTIMALHKYLHIINSCWQEVRISYSNFIYKK